MVHANPNMSNEEFQSFAMHLVPDTSSIRNLSIIPGTVIRDVYPLEGNEAAIGLDLSTQNEQAEAIIYYIHYTLCNIHS